MPDHPDMSIHAIVTHYPENDLSGDGSDQPTLQPSNPDELYKGMSD
jgi:hypothetical protein